MTSQNNTATSADREIVLTRDFEAPRELVFDAWTKPEHLAQWWGPDGFTTTIHQMDVRPGGVLQFMLHGPDGVDYPNHIAYTEVVRPGRLAFQHGREKDDPSQFEVTATFDQLADRTRLTMRMVFPTVEQRNATVESGATELGYQTLRHLAEFLARGSRSPRAPRSPSCNNLPGFTIDPASGRFQSSSGTPCEAEKRVHCLSTLSGARRELSWS